MTADFPGQTPLSEPQPHGWSGSLTEFLVTPRQQILESLKSAHQASFSEEAGNAQQNAWNDQLKTLHREFSRLNELRPSALNWSIIFEYELPRERGRRPDVILLTGPAIVVLEFKGAHTTTRAAVDQLQAYTRDLREYHAGSHNRSVHAVLVLSQGDAIPAEFEQLLILYRQDLGTALGNFSSSEGNSIRLQDWLRAPYAPLPSLVAAARRIFENEPLPAIRRAQSAGITSALDALHHVALVAQQQGERHLALVTGVPGAGKTLVGLQFVYGSRREVSATDQDAIFLSGNGPLVEVLQHALGKSKVFVRDVHGFLQQYGGAKNTIPGEHIWVYDEAQRAWDSERVLEKRKHAYSEPEDFVRLGDRMHEWAFIVGLVGEGQEIHLGEESGLGQWDDAISKSSEEWIVHCPGRLSQLFGNASSVVDENVLDLTESLRSHVAEDVPQWIATLFEGRLDESRMLMEKITDQGFDSYLTRSMDAASSYLRQRYDGQSTMRFGLLASSKARNLDKYNVKNEFQYSRRVHIGPWFNDPPDSVDSCCQLREVATEFACQGLELDFPLICWGDDLWWDDGWKTKAVRRAKSRDPHQLRLNSYRVLLSRGRDGFIVWVPPEVALDSTYNGLLHAGLRELEDFGGIAPTSAPNGAVT